MKLRKSGLGLAVGVALGTAAMIPATSFGWSVNTQTLGLSTNSGGDTILFPLYSTVQALGQVSSSFSVINSGNQTILAKIRFREQEHSMDVMDLLVVLSPHDTFPFSVGQDLGAERPHFAWQDSSCVVGPGASYDPAIDGDAPKKVDFKEPYLPFVATNEQMSVGHLEVLGMATLDNVWVNGDRVLASDELNNVGDLNTVNLGAAAAHGPDGIPADCPLLVQWLANPARVATLNNSHLLGDVPNDLSGRYLITGTTETAQGIEGGGDGIGIRDSNLTTVIGELGPYARITAQSDADCVNCLPIGTQYAWARQEWDHPHLGEMRTLNNFQLGLTADSVLGDWSNNPANFVGVDWVLSFPSKYAYIDWVNADDCAGGLDNGGDSTGNMEWCLLDYTRTGYGLPLAWTGTPSVSVSESEVDPIGITGDCLGLLDNQVTVLDRNEQRASDTVTVSPGARPTLDFCRELQVFTFAPAGAAEPPRDSMIQTPELRDVIAFENLDAIFGWAGLGLSFPLIVPGTNDVRYGDAVTGVIFTTRATENPIVNNGSITDLQKKSPYNF